MAKINPVKLKQDADKEEKAGRLEKAILLLRQIVDDNPKDWNTVNKIGDLYARLGRNKDAAGEYAKVADFYAQDGFLLKSIAIWKKINKLDTTSLDPYLQLADLYSKQGLMMEAKSQYQVVVDEYIKRGKMRDAGDVLKKMADIDPADLKIRSKLADLYTREGNAGKAVEEHIAIAEELNKKGHLAEALQVLEKGLKLDPRSNRLRTELARIHLVQKNYEKASVFLEEAVQLSPNDPQILSRLGEAYVGAKKLEEAEAIYKRVLELDPRDDESRGQMARVFLLQGHFDRSFDEMVPLVERLTERREGDRAVALLQQIVQRNPSHIKTLLKLADLYGQQRKDNLVTQTYSQLTEAYINQGQLEQAVSVLEMLVGREPSNGQYKTKLDFVRGKLASSRPSGGGGAASSAPEVVEASAGVDEEFDLSEPLEAQPYVAEAAPTPATPTRAGGPAPGPASVPARPVIEASGPLTDEDKEFIEEHLAEGKVFRKYGLVDKAADQFEAIVARFPDNVEARQELREVYKEKGQPARAAEQSLALAEISRQRGDMAGAETHENEARRLAPSLAAAAAPPTLAVDTEDEEQEIPLEVEDEEEVSLGEAEDEEISLDVEEEEEKAPVAAAEPELTLGQEEPAQFIGDDEEPAADEFPLDEPAEPAASPFDDEPSLGLEEEPALGQDQAFSPEPSLEPEPAFEPEPVFEPPPAPAPAQVPPELQRILDEVESYVALGFVDDARDALREVAARYPGHPAIQAKGVELGLDQEPPAPAAEEAVADEEPELSLDMSLESPVEEAPSAPEPPDLDLDEPLEEPAEPGLELGEGPGIGDELGLEEPPPEEPPAPEPSLELEAPPAEEEDLLGDSLGAPAASGNGEGEFEGGLDLGAELGGLFSAHAAVEEPAPEESSTDLGDAGLSEIFKEFKKGVDRQLSREDYDTRYNLGIAYKEMGLIDEAIAEFQLAAKDEARLLECSSMLGICFMEKGMPKLAVKWFEKGLKAPGRSDDEYLALRYDLAQALEAAGELDRALSLYTDLYGQDANFRDVAAKVRELQAAQG